MSSSDVNNYPGLNLSSAHGDAHQIAEVSVFGFWVFIMSDLIIFGILFATYAAYLTPMGVAGAPGPETLFDVKSVALQTGFLLASGLAYAGVSLTMKHADRVGPVILWLLISAILGSGFLYFEVTDLITQASKGGTPQASGWLSAYWTLVGLHGLHVFTGIMWILISIAHLLVRGLDDTMKVRLSVIGVFWHFLDVIWIGIFSFVFLVPLA